MSIRVSRSGGADYKAASRVRHVPLTWHALACPATSERPGSAPRVSVATGSAPRWPNPHIGRPPCPLQTRLICLLSRCSATRDIRTTISNTPGEDSLRRPLRPVLNFVPSCLVPSYPCDLRFCFDLAIANLICPAVSAPSNNRLPLRLPALLGSIPVMRSITPGLPVPARPHLRSPSPKCSPSPSLRLISQCRPPCTTTNLVSSNLPRPRFSLVQSCSIAGHTARTPSAGFLYTTTDFSSPNSVRQIGAPKPQASACSR